MKTSFILLSLFFSIASFAQEMTCLDKLLPFNRYSGLHQVTKDEWSDSRDVFDAETAKNVMTFLTNSKLLCRQGEVVIKVQAECSTTVPDLAQSYSCFIFTNVGYFVITRDNSRNFNFIFSKDKRFSDNL